MISRITHSHQNRRRTRFDHWLDGDKPAPLEIEKPTTIREAIFSALFVIAGAILFYLVWIITP